VYEVAFATAATEYVMPFVFVQTDDGPEIVPGIPGAGVGLTVTARQLAELLPQAFTALTQMFPGVVPNDTVIDVVP
jgi:hypothetical protein